MNWRSLFSAALMLAVAAQPAFAVELQILDVRGTFPAQLVDAYRRLHPDVQLTFLPEAADYDDMTQHLLRDHLTGATPDLIAQGYNRSAATIDAGIAVPLDPLIAKEQNWAEHYKAVSDALCQSGGKVYGLPFSVSIPIIFLNADLARQAGYDPATPLKSWDDITTLAQKIGKLGNGVMGGWVDYAGAGNFIFLGALQSLGGHMMSPGDQALALNGPEGLKALGIFSAFGKSGFVDMTREQGWQAFASGKAGMLLTSSGFLSRLQQNASAFKLASVPFPLVDGASLPAGGNCLMITTRDPAKAAAGWDFAKFMTSPDSERILLKATGYLPGNALAIDPTAAGQDPNSAIAAREAVHAGDFYSFPGANSLRISDVIKNRLQQVLIGRTEPADALAQMAADIQPLLPR